MRKYPPDFGAGSRLYRIWRSMHSRCYQPTHKAQARYSAAGITICDEWRQYEPFMRWAMSFGYADGLEVDRRDNTRGYSPENCRWVSRSANARNRNNNLTAVVAFGDSKTPIEWAESTNCAVSYQLLLKRLNAGWPPETALAIPSQGRKRPFGQHHRGSARPEAKLTDDEVRQIRASTLSESRLGALYGISSSNAGLIRRGKTWTHVA